MPKSRVGPHRWCPSQHLSRAGPNPPLPPSTQLVLVHTVRARRPSTQGARTVGFFGGLGPRHNNELHLREHRKVRAGSPLGPSSPGRQPVLVRIQRHQRAPKAMSSHRGGVWGARPPEVISSAARCEATKSRRPRATERPEGGGVANSGRPADAPAAVWTRWRGGVPTGPAGPQLGRGETSYGRTPRSLGSAWFQLRGTLQTCQISSSNHKTTDYSIRVNFSKWTHASHSRPS